MRKRNSKIHVPKGIARFFRPNGMKIIFFSVLFLLLPMPYLVTYYCPFEEKELCPGPEIKMIPAYGLYGMGLIFRWITGSGPFGGETFIFYMPYLIVISYILSCGITYMLVKNIGGGDERKRIHKV